jgi:Spy/CpxP family protein refolding chaperone
MKQHHLLIGFTLSLLMASASAQHNHPGHGSAQGHSHRPYAGMQTRTIKALSDQEIADLRAGKGMSMALPAELNGYPGPSHVLKLAEPLKLTEQQKSRTQTLFKQMQEESRAAGEAVIAAETELDALFKNKQANATLLSPATAKSAAAQGRLRETHLRHHLYMMDVLTSEQVALYNRLRGY